MHRPCGATKSEGLGQRQAVSGHTPNLVLVTIALAITLIRRKALTERDNERGHEERKR